MARGKRGNRTQEVDGALANVDSNRLQNPLKIDNIGRPNRHAANGRAGGGSRVGGQAGLPATRYPLPAGRAGVENSKDPDCQ
jgi:hypothetical protein